MARRLSAVADVLVHHQPSLQCNLVMALFSLAALMGMLAQPAHAVGVAAPRYLYVLDETGDVIDMFSENLATGKLVHLVCPGSPNPLPLGGFGIVAPTSGRIDPTGSFLYLSDFGGSQVAGFQILPNGCLALVPPVLKTVGTNPSHLGISSSGEYFYVSDTCIPPTGGPAQGCVEGFMINPNGTMAPVPGGPTPAGVNAGGLAVDPVRELVYASDNGPGFIDATRFNPLTGALPGLFANATIRPNPFRMALDPVGSGLAGHATQYLLVLSNGPADLDCYTINTGGPGVAWSGAAPTGLHPHSVAVTPLGQFAYVTNFAGDSVQAYNINRCAGIAVDGAAVALPVGANPTGLTVDQTGRFVYVAANGTNQVFGYKVNLVNGTLVNFGVWPTGAGPVHVVTMP